MNVSGRHKKYKAKAKKGALISLRHVSESSSVIKQAGSELKLLPSMQQVSVLLFYSATFHPCLLSLMLHLTLKLRL